MDNIIEPECVIVSRPKSGLHWVRHCVEYFSGCRTPGVRRAFPLEELKYPNKYILARTHDVRSKNNMITELRCRFYNKDGTPIFKKMILLLRNYKECFMRSYVDYRSNSLLKAYYRNINAYDIFQGDKLLIYYEDIVNDFSEMEKVLKFLNIEYNLDGFDVKKHAKLSLEAYNENLLERDKKPFGRRLRMCVPVVDTQDLLKHGRCIIPEERKQLDLRVEKCNKVLFKKYLTRYKEENLDYGV